MDHTRRTDSLMINGEDGRCVIRNSFVNSLRTNAPGKGGRERNNFFKILKMIIKNLEM